MDLKVIETDADWLEAGRYNVLVAGGCIKHNLTG